MGHHRATTLNDAAKCVLVSFDSTMRSNPRWACLIDLIHTSATASQQCACAAAFRRGRRLSRPAWSDEMERAGTRGGGKVPPLCPGWIW